MKIAFLDDGAYAFASGASSAVGGAERDQWLLGAALAAFGWSVIVGVRNGLKAGERRLINGVHFIGLEKSQILLAWHRFLSVERPDWLFWESADHLLGPLVEVARFSAVRTAFHVAIDSDVQPRRALFRRPRWWPLYALGLERTDRILVQHEGQFLRLPSRWRAKAFLLPKVCILPGVVGDDVKVKPHNHREKYVAWVGMLRRHKRPDILIDIARKAPRIRFVVCGGPTKFMSSASYTEEIQSGLRETANIEYLGQISPERAHEIIANAAVLLSTSDEEGFPNVFTQAWSTGTPVVSLRVDPDRIIERMKLGEVSGSTDRAIADCLNLIESSQRRDEIAARARRFVVENYSAQNVVELFQRALLS